MCLLGSPFFLGVAVNLFKRLACVDCFGPLESDALEGLDPFCGRELFGIHDSGEERKAREINVAPRFEELEILVVIDIISLIGSL